MFGDRRAALAKSVFDRIENVHADRRFACYAPGGKVWHNTDRSKIVS